MQHIGILGKSTLQKFMNNSKVLILGANGMLGKMVSLYFASLNHFELILTAKNKSSFLSDQLGNDYEIFDVLNDDFQNFAKSIKPDVIINCIGRIKPTIDESDNISISETININSFFPMEIQKYSLKITQDTFKLVLIVYFQVKTEIMMNLRCQMLKIYMEKVKL